MSDSLKMFLIALVTTAAFHVFAGPYVLKLQGYVPNVVSHTVVGTKGVPEATETKANVPVLTAPNLEGMTVAQARDRWRNDGIMIAEDGEREHPGAPPGTIVSQRPEPGETIANKEVRVIVAKGGEIMAVPSVVGMPVAQAREALVKAGFEVPPETGEASDKPEGTVLRQEPNPGATASKGSIARIVISQTAQVEVPKVTGKHMKGARTALEAVGLIVGTTRQVEHEEHGTGFVLNQEPSPGTKVAKGTAVNLTIVAPP